LKTAGYPHNTGGKSDPLTGFVLPADHSRPERLRLRPSPTANHLLVQ